MDRKRSWALGLLMLAGVIPALAAEPVLKNGGFDKQLAPWTCEDGKLVSDPEAKGNSLLEITLDGGYSASARL